MIATHLRLVELVDRANHLALAVELLSLPCLGHVICTKYPLTALALHHCE
jgi:hypothetical protein